MSKGSMTLVKEIETSGELHEVDGADVTFVDGASGFFEMLRLYMGVGIEGEPGTKTEMHVRTGVAYGSKGEVGVAVTINDRTFILTAVAALTGTVLLPIMAKAPPSEYEYEGAEEALIHLGESIDSALEDVMREKSSLN